MHHSRLALATRNGRPAAPCPDEFKIILDRTINNRRCIYSPERDQQRDCLRNIVEDIVSGELEGVARILSLNEADGTCRNVTEDIAREVLRCVAGHADAEIGRSARNFLHEQLGPVAVESELNFAAEHG